MHNVVIYLSRIIKLIAIICLAFSLPACATIKTVPPANPKTSRTLAYLQQGKRYFKEGYYRKAMRELLPLACDGDAEAQYAVGYMYYYGYGVAQDTETGLFWISRSACQHYQPAIKALAMIQCHESEPPRSIPPGRFTCIDKK